MKEYREQILEDGCKGYTVLVYQSTETSALLDGRMLYGVSVEKQHNGRLSEREETGPISDNMCTISNLLSILARNLVTPISLCCIVDELLSYFS